MSAMESSAVHFATAHASVGSNIGPGVPIVLALAVIGLVVYLIRRRKRASSNGPDDRPGT
jgi:uncharacterized protein (TIGR03382 family)